jgi:formylglycine-generating enzyme required for sulfatase activity
MLTGGERPFTGEQAEITGTTSALVRWEQINLQPPSLKEYNSELSASMEAVVRRCLAKRPEDRYPAPVELLHDLERAAAGEEVAAPPRPRAAAAADNPNVQPSNFQPSTGKSEAPTQLEPNPSRAESAGPESERPTQLKQEEKGPSRLQPSSAQTKDAWSQWGPWVGLVGIGALILALILGNRKPPEPETVVETVVVEKEGETVVETVEVEVVITATPESASDSTEGSGEQTRPSNADGMTMVYIPAGEFLMGSEEGDDDEEPVHEVYTDAFWMDQHEVTLGQYKEFLEDSGYNADPCGNGENHPAACVSWEDARAYCEWVDRRLPTEAEWEKAARGGLEGKKYPWGDQEPVCEVVAENGAQYGSCNGRTKVVMSFAPNGYGLYDMTGNVWEWVNDWYDSGYYVDSPRENPPGPSSGDARVLRGNSWYGNPGNLRAANRNRRNPDDSYDEDGFRCASSD